MLPDPANIFTTERVLDIMRQLVSGERGRTGASTAVETADELMTEWLEELRSSGGMVRIEDCDAHDTPFLRSWNALAEGTWDDGSFWNSRERHLHTLSSKLGDIAMMPFYSFDRKEADEEPASEAVREIAAAIHANVLSGRSGPYHMLEGETCRISGIRLALDLDGWKPVMGIMDRSTRRIRPSNFVPPTPVDHVVVSFGGGPVLVGDWFRIPEFTSAVDPEGREFDLSTELGAREYVRHYARKGFVSVHVGNTCPSVLPFGEGLVVGRADEDADDSREVPKEMGSVCTDLWRVTMIEKERLVEIVAGTLGREEAEKTVEAYLEEHPCDATIVVPAGEHHLYFSGHHELFVESFHSEDLPLPGAVDPFFVLSMRELALSSKPAPDSDGTYRL